MEFPNDFLTEYVCFVKNYGIEKVFSMGQCFW